MAHMHIKLDMLNDADIISVIQTLSLSKIKLKEECSMNGSFLVNGLWTVANTNMMHGSRSGWMVVKKSILTHIHILQVMKRQHSLFN